jgi:hypothetical protein
VIAGAFEKKIIYISDFIIINSSFVRNDLFLEGLDGEKRTMGCYNKPKRTYVKLSKEGNTVFAEWGDNPYSAKFYFGTCLRGSASILP